MSFSSEVKDALARELPEKECCRDAMLYGMLLFTAQPTDKQIAFSTEIESVAEAFAFLIRSRFRLDVQVKKSGLFYKTEITGSDCAFVCAVFPPDARTVRREFFACEKCGAAFFRGVFLASGFVNPPEKSFRVEMSTPDADLACDTAVLLTSHFRLPKLSVRRGEQILYYRDAESVEYFLSYIGANAASFAVMNAQMLKEKRREVNRQANFEFANLSKTVNAAADQITAIRALIDMGAFEKLPAPVRVTAKLRLEHDDVTAAELGALHEPPISRSQVSKRLKRVTDFYQSLKS